MMFQPCASVASSSTLMPNCSITVLPYQGSAASSATTTADTTMPAVLFTGLSLCLRFQTRSCGPSEEPARPQDQHQQQHAEARDIPIGRAEIQRGQRFDDAEDESANDDAQGIVEPADDRNGERLRRERPADVRVDLRHRAVKPPGDPCQRGAKTERQRVDALRIDAIEPRRDEVLRRRANAAPDARMQ